MDLRESGPGDGIQKESTVKMSEESMSCFLADGKGCDVPDDGKLDGSLVTGTVEIVGSPKYRWQRVNTR